MNNYLFTGQEKDSESALYNYNARLYNPKTGAFISADTVGGGNRYSYAANNPTIHVDPSGNSVWDVVEDIWETIKVAYGSMLAEQFAYSAGDYKAYKTLSNEYREEKSAVIAGELGVLNLAYSVPAIISYLQFSKDYYYYNYAREPILRAKTAAQLLEPGNVVVRPAYRGELTSAVSLHPGSAGAPAGKFVGHTFLHSGEIVYNEMLWETYTTPAIPKPEHMHEMEHWNQFVERGYENGQNWFEYAWDEITAFEAEINYLKGLGAEADIGWFSHHIEGSEVYISGWEEMLTGWYNRGRGAYEGW